MIISISGNIASGKTTLAKKICSLYSFEYVPSKKEEYQFLDDFYENVPRYFLSTQSCFLINKASEICDRVKNHQNIVIDRSIHEDIHIFARYWMDRYDIDEREKSLYMRIASYITKTIPESDAYVYCQCSPKVSLKRISLRAPRSFESNFPQNFIHDLYDCYSFFRFPSTSVFECNSERNDFSDDYTVTQIMERILELVKRG